MKLAAEIARLGERVFGVDRAETAPELRRAAAARAEFVTGLSAATPELPAEWQKYVDKVALHAYKVTDEDVQALRRAGHSEDAIFEVTVATAVGASFARARKALD
ncbi:MAG: hypothetical protein ACREQQ_13865, partial [Candidatus Binatia bacterium]